MHQIDTPMDYHLWGAMSERHRRYTQSWLTLLSWKTVLLTIWNDLTKDFIDIKAIALFRTRLLSRVPVAGGNYKHCLNVEW